VRTASSRVGIEAQVKPNFYLNPGPGQTSSQQAYGFDEATRW
jgi:hypothetical protein